MPQVDPSALAGVQLMRKGVEVRMSKQSVRARLFGGEPEPTRLGRFVVVNRVGIGGMGVVYAAYDPQLDRKVALKVLRNDVVRSRRGERQRLLLAEARAMARLSHVNVVTVFEVGTVDEQVFVAMEFVDAPTLRQWSAQSTHTPTETTRVFLQAGLGLAAAHRAGLIHRDFKPENVMVPTDGPVQVTDFGLAIGLESGPEDSASQMTRIEAVGASQSILTQGLAGTPAYMAPEQLASKTVDARADQYAFCVALYEALGGSRPFSDADIARMHADPDWHAPLAPLPDHVRLPKRVAQAIARGLSPAVDDRFEDMPALLRRLQPRRAGRRSIVLLGIVGAAGLGAGALIVGSSQTCRAPHQRLQGVWDDASRDAGRASFSQTGLPFAADAWQRAEAELDSRAAAWVEMHVAACVASQRGEQSDARLDRRMRCLDGQLEQLAAVAGVFRTSDASVVQNSVRVVEGIGVASDCASPSELLVPIEPEVERTLGAADALLRSAKFEASLAKAEAAVVLAQQAESPASHTLSVLSRGRAELALARTAKARTSFELVIDAAAETAQFDLVAAAAIELANVVGVADADHESGLVLASAAAISVASAGDSPALRARLELLHARLLYRAGRLDEGLEHAGRGLLILGNTGERAQAEFADALQVQGTLLYAKDRLGSAREFSTRALELRRTVFGPAHPSVAESLSNLGAIGLAERNPGAAVTAFEQAFELRSEAFGADHPETAKALANLGSARIANGDLVGAQEALVDALKRLERTVGEEDPRVAAVLLNLGGVRYELGEADAAIEAYTRALEVQKATLGAEHPQRSIALANLGRAHLEAGRAAKAVGLLEEALSIRTRVLGPEHPRTSAAHVTLAAAYIDLSRLADARRQLDAAHAGDDAASQAEIALWRGRVALAEADFAKARDHLETALALRESAPDRGSVVAVQVLLAHAVSKLGDRERAMKLASAAAEVLQGEKPPPELREFCRSDCAEELARIRTAR